MLRIAKKIYRQKIAGRKLLLGRSIATAACTILFFFSSIANVSAQGSEAPLEFKLKAVVLYNFAKYVSWPSASFSTPDDPIQICILEPNPFGDIFDSLAKTAQNRKVVAKIIGESMNKEIQTCHILYYSGQYTATLQHIEKSLKEFGILTVTEDEGKGIIEFVMQDDKVRFKIDNSRAKQAGLAINSQLLKLAIEVKN